MDEVALYLFIKWEKSEKTYNEKWKEQSMSLTKKIDKTKKKAK